MSDDSVERYEKMLADDPRSLAFAPLAEVHRKAGRLDEAIRVARIGLEEHPGYSGGLVVLGRALFEKRELDNAAEVLQKAVDETPESYLGQKFLGKVLLDKGENQGAMKALQAAYMLSPEDEEIGRLLEEVKNKAEPPDSMEYEAEGTESDENAQIVTYEQKPTTVDGVELPPLPTTGTDETYSFSGGDVAEPADVTPATVEQEFIPSDFIEDETTPEEVREEETAATIVEEEEVQEVFEADTFEELGPEAAAFIMEGAAEEVQGVPADDSTFPVSGQTAEESPVEEDSAQARVAPPLTVPEPAPPDESEVSVIDTFSPEPEVEDTAGEERFSTETLADLYAQQGLTDKAESIYRQILEKKPDNESVKLKLESIKAVVPDQESEQEVHREEAAEPTSEGAAEGALAILEGMLENLERMKRS